MLMAGTFARRLAALGPPFDLAAGTLCKFEVFTLGQQQWWQPLLPKTTSPGPNAWAGQARLEWSSKGAKRARAAAIAGSKLGVCVGGGGLCLVTQAEEGPLCLQPANGNLFAAIFLDQLLLLVRLPLRMAPVDLPWREKRSRPC